MSPDRRLPRWARIAGRSGRVVGYLMTLVVGLADTLVPSATIDGVLPTVQIGLTSALMVALGLVGVVSILAHRWRWEFPAVAVLSMLLLARSIPVWFSLHEEPTRLSAAAMMVLGAAGMAMRTLDLWVFSKTTEAVAIRSKRTFR